MKPLKIQRVVHRRLVRAMQRHRQCSRGSGKSNNVILERAFKISLRRLWKMTNPSNIFNEIR